jgi:rhodanese-related sulfurtransferase
VLIVYFITFVKKNKMDLTQKDWIAKHENDIKNNVILDVRTPEEWMEGHLENAIHIDIYKGQEFVNEVAELDKTKNYFIYCKAGGRSAQACSIMSQLGFPNTFNLIGGMLQWEGKVVFP